MVAEFVKMTGKSEADAIADLTRGVPMKRVAEIDEVVEVILFAADPKNSFMTGHALAVDGGIAAVSEDETAAPARRDVGEPRRVATGKTPIAVSVRMSASVLTDATVVHSVAAWAPAPSAPNITQGMPASLRIAQSVQNGSPRRVGLRPSALVATRSSVATIGSVSGTSNGPRFRPSSTMALEIRIVRRRSRR